MKKGKRMTIILKSATPIVRKLVERVAQKRGDVLLDDQAEYADLIIVDDSERDGWSAGEAREIAPYTLYIGSRFDETPDGYEKVLAKPFLPEELMDVLAAFDVTMAEEDLDVETEAETLQPESEPTDFESGESVLDEHDVDELKAILDTFDDEVAEAETAEAETAFDLETEAEEEAEDFADAFDIDSFDDAFDDASESHEDEYLDGFDPEEAFDHRETEASAAFSESGSEEEIFGAETAFDDLGESEKTYEDTAADEAVAYAAPAEVEERLSGEALHSRGVEALQDVMAILSDESVARALKEMGVRVDISFGERR